MNLWHKIESIRQGAGPEAKQQIVFLSAFIITGIVALVWLVGFGYSVRTLGQEKVAPTITPWSQAAAVLTFTAESFDGSWEKIRNVFSN